MKKRFSKTSMLENLIAVSESIRVANKFDPRDGTAQLKKYRISLTENSFIDKCIEYGKWKMLNAFICDIEDGNL